MNLSIAEIRRRIGSEEFTSDMLNKVLSEYSFPRQKISLLKKRGHILSVTRGVYVWGKALRKRPISTAHLANLVYRPSYISTYFSLFHHGLTHNPPQTITSMTSSRSKTVKSSISQFEYIQIPKRNFSVGTGKISLSVGAYKVSVLMAYPESALADLLITVKGLKLKNFNDIEEFLYKKLELDRKKVKTLSKEKAFDIACIYKTRKTTILAEYLNSLP